MPARSPSCRTRTWRHRAPPGGWPRRAETAAWPTARRHRRLSPLAESCGKYATRPRGDECERLRAHRLAEGAAVADGALPVRIRAEQVAEVAEHVAGEWPLDEAADGRHVVR